MNPEQTCYRMLMFINSAVSILVLLVPWVSNQKIIEA